MANADIIIVDFPSLEQALSEYRALRTHIDEIIQEMQAMIRALDAGWVSKTAASAFGATMQTLVNTFTMSQTELEARIKELQDAYDAAVAAEQEAASIASSIEAPTINMV